MRVKKLNELKITLYLNILLSCYVSSQASKKYNVLFVIVDDLRHIGDDIVQFPNLNKLTKMGVSFENAFAQQALCAPSRNSLLTGRRPDSLRLYDFYSYWRESAGNFTTLPQYLKENSYETYSIGKVFHYGKSSNFTDDYPYSWSGNTYHPSTVVYKDAAVCYDRVSRKLQKNLICPVVVKKQPERTLPDLQSLQHAIKMIEYLQGREKPFFLAVGFHKPHIPLKFPRKYFKNVPKSTISAPQHPSIPKFMPTVAYHPWLDLKKRDDIARLNISFPFGIMPTKWSRKIRRGYTAAIAYIDDLIGILMKSVQFNDTIVVITSDHGWSLGENGLWAKYSNFDDALKVPLIFIAPGFEPRSISTPVELIDIFPTLTELIVPNKQIPNCEGRDNRKLCFEGKSLLKLLYGTETNSESYFAISQYPRPSVYPRHDTDKPLLKNIKIMGYTIRTKTHRYTEWISFNHKTFTRNWTQNYGMELYDHTLDLLESINLVNNPKYSDLIKHLSMLLKRKIEI